MILLHMLYSHPHVIFTCEICSLSYVILIYDHHMWCSHTSMYYVDMWCWYRWYMTLIYDTHIWGLVVLVYDVGIWCWYMILTYENKSCWYMMLAYDVQKPTFSLRYMMITCEHHMWSSYTAVFTTVCDFTCDLWDFHMWSWYMKFGIWSWYMKLVYDVGIWYWYMMSHVNIMGFGIWCLVYESHMWLSSLIICRTVYDHIRTFFEKYNFQKKPYMMFTCEHFRIWCSHVNTFPDEMLPLTLTLTPNPNPLH